MVLHHIIRMNFESIGNRFINRKLKIVVEDTIVFSDSVTLREFSLIDDLLPSESAVLRYFHHQYLVNKLKARMAAIKTAKAVREIWLIKGIGVTQDVYVIAKKVEALFKEFNTMKKKKNNCRPLVTRRRNEYFKRLKREFDISKSVGIMYQNDPEDESLIHENDLSDPAAELSIAVPNQQEIVLPIAGSSSTEAVNHPLNNSFPEDNANESAIQHNYDLRHRADDDNEYLENDDLRPSKTVLSMFDRVGMSYRNSSLAYLTIMESLGYNPADAICSSSTMFRLRTSNRKNEAERIHDTFNSELLKTIHVDGKTYKERGERREKLLAIVLSNRNEAKLLEMVEVERGTGNAHAEAIFQTMIKWNIIHRVHSISYDTEGVNTGNVRGVGHILEAKLDRALLRLPCRHHILEVILSKVFAVLLENKETVESPTIKLFEQFSKQYFKEDFQRELYTSCLNDSFVADLFTFQEIKNIKDFCRDQLQKINSRSDYVELLQLTLKMLGEQNRYNIQAPGSYSRARFINKILYCMKMYLYKDQLEIDAVTITSIKRFLIFVLKVYLIKWFRCTNSVEAPRNDLEMLKSIYDLETLLPNVAKHALVKIRKHLWYLSETLIALSFFDRNVPIDEKRRMIERIEDEPNDEADPNRAEISEELEKQDVLNLRLSNFVSKRTMRFFDITGIDRSFLNVDPNLWEKNESYIRAQHAAELIPVVNDAAERSIAMYQQYKDRAKDKTHRDNLLQVVEQERKKFKSLRKCDIVQALRL